MKICIKPRSARATRRPGWLIRGVMAFAVSAGLVLAGTGSASAEGLSATSGQAGAAHVMAFGGGYERNPSDGYHLAPASVKCMNNSIHHQAVLAGGYAWAYNAHRGTHNEWQYARYAAVARDTVSHRLLLGPLSPTARAWDNAPARFGQNYILLERGHTYTIYAMFFYYNSKGKMVGSRIITPQIGAWAISISSSPYGEYWYVSKRATITC